MSEAVELVARGLRLRSVVGRTDESWGDVHPDNQELWRAKARRMINAANGPWKALEAAEISLREALAPFRPMDSKARAEKALEAVQAALAGRRGKRP